MPIRNRGGTTTHTGQLDAGMHTEFVDSSGLRHIPPSQVNAGHKVTGSIPSPNGGPSMGLTRGDALLHGKGQFPRGKKSI